MNNSVPPKISIITCFLNVEQYLEEMIESVLQQEYENWELLLIDDGSTDNSTSIAKKYVSRYPGKIIYREHNGHSNRGASASRNVGIDMATGEFIAFLDADDVWLPDLLSCLLTLMQAHSVALVCEASEYWYDWSNTERQNVIIPVGTEQDRYYAPPQLMLNLYPLGKGAAPCPCGMLVKKESVKNTEGLTSLCGNV